MYINWPQTEHPTIAARCTAADPVVPSLLIRPTQILPSLQVQLRDKEPSPSCQDRRHSTRANCLTVQQHLYVPDLIINGCYFAKQHWSVGICNGDAVCLL
jgi:hypothetical protein